MQKRGKIIINMVCFIDRLDPENSLAVIGRVASACERQGLLEDAVYLFDLAGQKDRAVDIVNRILVPLVPSVDNKGECVCVNQLAEV